MPKVISSQWEEKGRLQVREPRRPARKGPGVGGGLGGIANAVSTGFIIDS